MDKYSGFGPIFPLFKKQWWYQNAANSDSSEVHLSTSPDDLNQRLPTFVWFMEWFQIISIGYDHLKISFKSFSGFKIWTSGFSRKNTVPSSNNESTLQPTKQGSSWLSPLSAAPLAMTCVFIFATIHSMPTTLYSIISCTNFILLIYMLGMAVSHPFSNT